MRRRSALLGVLVVLLLLRGSLLLSAVWVNAGMLVLCDALMAQADSAPGTYPVYEALDETPATVGAIQNLRRAVALDQSGLTARWALGRAALAMGDGEMAADALGPLAGRVGDNPFLYHDALIAHSYGGRPEGVIAFYESTPPPQPTWVISDAVTLAYLETSRAAGGQGGEEALTRAAQLRPDDLYVNYYLWQATIEAEDVEAAVVYSETLTYFPLEAVRPADERLMDYAAEVIPALLEDGLWDREKTLNVVSFLVWQRNRVEGVERLMERLMEGYPTEPDWPFYLAELYHRRGDLERAEVAYRQVLALDPDYAQAYLRLGMVAEASCEGLQEAARWYKQYNEIVPDDLLGLKKLTEVYEVLSRPEAATLREELEARTDDRRIVAELLGMPMEAVELGPSLVENGGFEEWVDGRPRWWVWSAMFNREPFDAATFAAGVDELLPFEGKRAARVDGFWIEHQEGKSPARAGFWQVDEIVGGLRPLALTTSVPYVLSFQYRTSRIPDGKVTVWVSSSDEPDVFWSGGDYGLPATGGAWYRFVAVGWNRSDAEAAIRPLIRSYAPGCVGFDDVQVRPIWFPKGIALEAGETQFRVTERND